MKTMKTMILAAALMIPGITMAGDMTCTVNSEVVTLAIYTLPNADIAAYRYQQTKDGTFISINYVDGAYDLYIQNGRTNLSEARRETLDVNATFGGKDLTIVCP